MQLIPLGLPPYGGLEVRGMGRREVQGYGALQIVDRLSSDFHRTFIGLSSDFHRTFIGLEVRQTVRQTVR